MLRTAPRETTIFISYTAYAKSQTVDSLMFCPSKFANFATFDFSCRLMSHEIRCIYPRPTPHRPLGKKRDS